MCNMTLKACGTRQNMQGRLQFERSLRYTLSQHRAVKKNRVAFIMVLVGFVTMSGAVGFLAMHWAETKQSLWFLLQ